MTVRPIDETKDGWAASVLTAERDLTTSEQSGETFCWETDDVIDEYGRYEWYEDLYPEVEIDRTRDEDGEYLPIRFGQSILEAQPDLETLEFQLGEPEQEDNIVATDFRLQLYRFNRRGTYGDASAGVLVAPGTLESLQASVDVSDMWSRLEGTDPLPEWVSFEVIFEANWLGATNTHSLAASVHPLEDVRFVGAMPEIPPIDDFRWPLLRASQYPSFTFAGTGNHSVARRTGYTDYLPWSALGAVNPRTGLGRGSALGAAVRSTREYIGTARAVSPGSRATFGFLRHIFNIPQAGLPRRRCRSGRDQNSPEICENPGRSFSRRSASLCRRSFGYFCFRSGSRL